MKLVFLDMATLSLSGDISFERFKSYGDAVFYNNTSSDQVQERIIDADIVFTNKTPIAKSVICKCKNLKYISVMATGTNIIEDIQFANKSGIVITNTPGYSTNAVAELTFSLILEFAKKVYSHNIDVKSGEWEASKYFTNYKNGIFELFDKTLGIIGYGNIGKKVATIAKSFDMNVLVCTRTPQENKLGVNFVCFDHLIKNSDIISIHAPLSSETKNLFDKKVFDKMKKTAYLINTARGPIVNERDIKKALNCERIAGYGADVVSKEPISKNNPLLNANNCILTPHIAWANFETRVRLLDIIEDNLKSFLKGKSINKVTE